jgi:hypothetical protein
MRLPKTEPLASVSESAGSGADNGSEESSATNIQRGSANAPGLSIAGDALAAVTGECDEGAEPAGDGALPFGASVTRSTDVIVEPTHQG